MRNLYFPFILFLLLACDTDSKKQINRESLRFHTTDDAELFFKNLRRTEYDYQNLKAAKLDIFRHQDRNQEADYPLLIPALVVNWRYDEAYIVLEANELLGEVRPLIVEWQDKQQQRGQYILESNNKMEQLKFASQLYEGIQQGRQFYLHTNSTSMPFMEKPTDRRVFRTTLFDYYRLTRNIR
ncbi:hypothetical protein D770_14760 [Flammeovirgaceae bacterium 311]|nr:hypothetical protein D770_14760 [Flammeovirgaceae bacterium 311]